MRPLSSHRRYWEERLELAVKAVVASVLVWLTARYLFHHEQPYFAPLAALLGVYPTVARSVRESLAYAAGFLIGAVLAIPVGILIGPNTLGIATVLVFALLVAGWRTLGEQASQVAFTALFALLLGGHEPVSYVLPRLADVAAGLVFGLTVNALLFPPVHLRRAEYAMLELKDDLAEAMHDLADAAPQQDGWWSRWRARERHLLAREDNARRAYAHGRDSLRGNARARLRGYRRRWQDAARPWPAPRLMNTLEEATAYLRSIAGTLSEANEVETEVPGFDLGFRERYAHLLHTIADLIGRLPEPAPPQDRDEADRLQRELEEPHKGSGTDGPGLWDPQKELIRLSRLMLDNAR